VPVAPHVAENAGKESAARQITVVRTRAEIRSARARLPEPVGFVPTMGALHAGHDSLVRRAREESASVVASIFVNPRQFGPGEDYERYPRDEASDVQRLAGLGVDLVFAPSVDEIYPRGFATSVDVGRLGEVLEGASRPGHFRGVATVVSVLFGLVRPQVAYFGQKDGQQTVVVRRIASDLGLSVEIRVCPTVRETDGLAVSSRNVYLTPEQRAAAPVLYRALREAERAYSNGEREADALRSLIARTVGLERDARLDYASVADLETLEELSTVDRPALASLAVRFGPTRLIDCVLLGEREGTA
jgi:pantoate--beta-alanine ligase